MMYYAPRGVYVSADEVTPGKLPLYAVAFQLYVESMYCPGSVRRR